MFRFSAYYSLLFLLASASMGCGGNDAKTIDHLPSKDSLIKINVTEMQSETDRIDAFCKRRHWVMSETGTGLRYMIYRNGYGILAKNGMTAKVKVRVQLLNGKEVYRTEPGETDAFKIGADNVESGLHEGITYLKVGDKARMILPSHMAYGFTGDMNNIPPMASLVFDIELCGLE